MCRHQRLISLAFKYTFESPHHIPIAAVVALGPRVIKHGVNQYKSHPKQKRSFNPHRLIHAELDAILGLPYEVLSNSVVYVCRRTKEGDAGMSKPCAVCEEVLRSYGVEKVVYSISGLKGNIEYGEMELQTTVFI
jgi:deoxycytidylate deaminase